MGVVTRCDSVQVTSHLVLACVRRHSGMQRLVVWPLWLRTRKAERLASLIMYTWLYDVM
jgi:hypothetical protein